MVCLLCFMNSFPETPPKMSFACSGFAAEKSLIENIKPGVLSSSVRVALIQKAVQIHLQRGAILWHIPSLLKPSASRTVTHFKLTVFIMLKPIQVGLLFSANVLLH